MPHYRDGSEARVGDFVHGKPYNTPHPVAGTVISITPDATSCNCQVVFRTVVPLAEIFGQPCRVLRASNGWVAAVERTDYGATSDFELLSRPSAPAASAQEAAPLGS